MLFLSKKIAKAARTVLFLLAGTAAVSGDPFRPVFHYAPAANWLNDPNGMVYFDGEYHLFYQYNPFGDRWGHMSWGHAVSRDLVRWEEIGLAIPEDGDIMIFSGSAVVDWNNTSGFGTGEEPPLVAIYTGHRTGVQDQRLAFSNDRGRTWTQYENNPVLDIGHPDFRDPKVFWHEESKRWIMAVALAVDRKISLYGSPDLKEWTHLSDFGPYGSVAGIWECPDLIRLPIENEPGKSRWVMIVNVGGGAPAGGSGCQYFTGEFDGVQFIADPVPSALPERVPAGRVLADFEGRDYGDWKVEGRAFGRRPATGAFAGQHPVRGFRGRGLVNSFIEGDEPQGTLTSPPFRIDANYISFLIGGGAHAETAIRLLVDGEVVRSSSGDNDETLNWKSWDVSPWKGKLGVIEIIDHHSGGWGHINVDHIVLASQAARPAREGALWADFGPDFYAAVTWSNNPREDGRETWIGWMSNWIYAEATPTAPWRGAMSVARDMSLRRTPEGLRLVQQPAGDFESMRTKHLTRTEGSLSEFNGWVSRQNIPDAFELKLELELPAATPAVIEFGAGEDATRLVLDLANRRMELDRTRSGQVDFHPAFPAAFEAPLKGDNGKVRLHVLFDRSSIEIFADDGMSVVTSLIFPRTDQRTIRFSGAEAARVVSFDLWQLESSGGKEQ